MNLYAENLSVLQKTMKSPERFGTFPELPGTFARQLQSPSGRLGTFPPWPRAPFERLAALPGRSGSGLGRFGAGLCIPLSPFELPLHLCLNVFRVSPVEQAIFFGICAAF